MSKGNKMTSNLSDSNGRALEFSIVKRLSDETNILVSKSTKKLQERDSQKFQNLEPFLQERFIMSSSSIFNWLTHEFDLKSQTVLLERMGDYSGTQGDVTDIRLKLENDQFINLSIKHNHSAIKHQRPGALMKQLGFSKESLQQKSYKENYDRLINTLLTNIKDKFPSCSTFEEVKLKDSEYIDKYVYNPICRLVCDYLNKFLDPISVASYFTFLVGKINFIKIIVYDKEIKLLKYFDIKQPTACKVYTNLNSYVILEFDNGWKISMRLHTASKRLIHSFKFDSQPIEVNNIPTEIIKV